MQRRIFFRTIEHIEPYIRIFLKAVLGGSLSLLIGCAEKPTMPTLTENDLVRARSTLDNAPSLRSRHDYNAIERWVPAKWAMLMRAGERLVQTAQSVCVDVAKKSCALEILLIRSPR